MNGKRQRDKKWWWIVGLAAGALTVGLLAWLRRRTHRRTIQRRFWNPVYDRLAHWYDGVDWFTGNTTHRWRRSALRYLPPAGSRVLEIGFGSGKLHTEMARQHRMAGLDLAPGMVHLTRRRLAARGLSSRLAVGSVYALPWPAESFDAVVSTFAFSTFPDAEAALDEMVRVTRPGGRVIIVDAGEASDGNRVAHLLARLWELMGDYMRDEVPLMEARGLAVEREEYGPWNAVHTVVGAKQIGIAPRHHSSIISK
ncbi:MAG TPA: class I SAM-dependent methyltransferase [Chloroflexi bacterium]|nr:class I SAM-dependent methyltransferase [Chloroflexota bacterium]